MIRLFNRWANAVAAAGGKPVTFTLAVAVILGWAVSGPIFGFSDTWQLVINTGTTIITFLMVFLIQNTQNRDGAAMQAKLDELIHAVGTADERFIGIEHLTDAELKRILEQVEARAARLHGGGDGALPVIATREEDSRAKARGAARAARKDKPAKAKA